MAFQAIKPYAVAVGVGDLDTDFETGLVYDDPVAFGDGSVVDDSDSSWLELGSYRDSSNAQHVETVVADFEAPAGATPTAMLVQIRARNSADVLGDDPGASRLFYVRLSDTATNDTYAYQALGNVAAANWWAGPLTEAGVSEPTWFSGWWQNHPDMSNPSDAGDWYDLTSDPAAAAALVAGTLRLTFAWRWIGDDTFSRRAWIDVFEVRLLLAGPGCSTDLPMQLTEWTADDVVGENPVGDSSDETYVAMSEETMSPSQYALGSLPLLEEPVADRAVAVTMNVRVASTTSHSSGTVPMEVVLYETTDWGTAGNYIVSFRNALQYWTVPQTGGGIQTFAVTPTDADYDYEGSSLDEVISTLAAGAWVSVKSERAGGDVHATTLTLYDAWLTVHYTCFGRLRRRPLRQHPRSDGLGISSARRVDADRSMQSTLRRGGGVYF
jgi:hypothetical protein